jgi:hypothetical protein
VKVLISKLGFQQVRFGVPDDIAEVFHGHMALVLNTNLRFR